MPQVTDINMDLWNRFCKTDPKYTTKVSRGSYTFTAVDAYYRVRSATEAWGSCGDRWGFKTQHEVLFEGHDCLVVCHLTLYYPGSQDRAEVQVASAVPLWNETKNGWKRDPEAWKKGTTDCLTKALSYLGFSADVFLGMFDDNRYVAERRREEADKAGMKAGGKKESSPHPQEKPLPVFESLEDMEKALAPLSDEAVMKQAEKLHERRFGKGILLGLLNASRGTYIDCMWHDYCALRERDQQA